MLGEASLLRSLAKNEGGGLKIGDLGHVRDIADDHMRGTSAWLAASLAPGTAW